MRHATDHSSRRAPRTLNKAFTAFKNFNFNFKALHYFTYAVRVLLLRVTVYIWRDTVHAQSMHEATARSCTSSVGRRGAPLVATLGFTALGAGVLLVMFSLPSGLLVMFSWCPAQGADGGSWLPRLFFSSQISEHRRTSTRGHTLHSHSERRSDSQNSCFRVQSLLNYSSQDSTHGKTAYHEPYLHAHAHVHVTEQLYKVFTRATPRARAAVQCNLSLGHTQLSHAFVLYSLYSV